MDPITTLSPFAATRYQGAVRPPAADEAARTPAATGSAPQQPPQPVPSAAVTFSRRAQELAAQEADDDAQAQRATVAVDATQEAQRTQAAQTAARLQSGGARAEADAQLRRAYSEPQGIASR